MINIFKIFTTGILLLTITSGAQASPSSPAYQIYTAEGKLKGVETLVGLVRDYDVVVFGEYHDNTVLHELELRLLTAAFKENRKLSVSLEMFERDTQHLLDNYLIGAISEDEFLEKSRPWKNYQADYRPLVEFAKNHSLPVLASNIPRNTASHYARMGSTETLEAEMKSYLPKVHVVSKGKYWENFKDTMKTNMGANMPVTAAKIEDYYKAQCLKDDTMAESIANFAKMNPDYTIIHYQGDFHSRYRLGVVEKLKALAPKLKVAVVSPVYLESFADIPTLLEQNRHVGDVIIFLKQKDTV